MKPGDQSFVYQGRSMRGTLRLGDLISWESTPFDTLKVGDVVVYSCLDSAEPTTRRIHRIVARNGEALVVQGDANLAPDRDPVTREGYIGKAISARRHGRALPLSDSLRCRCRRRLVRAWSSLVAHVWRAARLLSRPLYRILRRSGFVARFWKPRSVTASFESGTTSIVKTIVNGRTAVRRHGDQDRSRISRPFDLIFHHESEGEEP